MTIPVDQKIAQVFEGIARLYKVDDLEVKIKYWNPNEDHDEKARIYFNIGGSRRNIATFYYAIANDAFYASGGNATKRDAVDNAIKIARANIEQIMREYL